MIALAWVIGFWGMGAACIYTLMSRVAAHKPSFRLAIVWPFHAVAAFFGAILMYAIVFGRRLGLFTEKAEQRLEELGRRQVERLSYEPTRVLLGHTTDGHTARILACREIVEKRYGIRTTVLTDPQGRVTIGWTDHDDNAEISALIIGAEYGYSSAEHDIAEAYDRFIEEQTTKLAEGYSEVPFVPPARPV